MLFLHSLSGGGAQRRALTLADAFAAKGQRVDLMVMRPEGPLHNKIPLRIRLVPMCHTVSVRLWLPLR